MPRVGGQLLRPDEPILARCLDDLLKMPDRDIPGAGTEGFDRGQHTVAEQHPELRQVAAAGIGVDRVDGRDVARRAVHVQNAPAELLLQVRRHDTRPVAADVQVLAAHHRTVHRIVDDQRDRRPIGAGHANQVELPVHGPVRIQADGHATVHIHGATIDVGHRYAAAEGDPGWFKPLVSGPDSIDQRSRHLGGVLAIPLVVRSAEQRLVHVGRTDFRGSVGMRDAPQHVGRLDSGLPPQLGHHVVVEPGREEAKIARDEIERRPVRLERHDTVMNRVEHPGGLPCAIAAEPLRRVRRDVHFHG
jgi:hypothetical protein